MLTTFFCDGAAYADSLFVVLVIIPFSFNKTDPSEVDEIGGRSNIASSPNHKETKEKRTKTGI